MCARAEELSEYLTLLPLGDGFGFGSLKSRVLLFLNPSFGAGNFSLTSQTELLYCLTYSCSKASNSLMSVLLDMLCLKGVPLVALGP